MGASTRRTRFTRATLLAIFNVFIILYAGAHTDTTLSASDFGQYYVAAQRFRAGERVYDVIIYDRPTDVASGMEATVADKSSDSRDSHRMPNPPPWLLLLWPLAFIPYSLGWWCVCLSSLLIIAGVGYRVARELFGSPLERATWVAVSLGSFPTLVNGLLNHIEPFVWAVMTWGWLRLRRGDEKVAGVLLGLAGCLKLFPLVFIPMLLSAGYRRASVFAAASAATGIAVSAAIIGYGLNAYLCARGVAASVSLLLQSGECFRPLRRGTAYLARGGHVYLRRVSALEYIPLSSISLTRQDVCAWRLSFTVVQPP